MRELIHELRLPVEDGNKFVRRNYCIAAQDRRNGAYKAPEYEGKDCRICQQNKCVGSPMRFGYASRPPSHIPSSGSVSGHVAGCSGTRSTGVPPVDGTPGSAGVLPFRAFISSMKGCGRDDGAEAQQAMRGALSYPVHIRKIVQFHPATRIPGLHGCSAADQG